MWSCFDDDIIYFHYQKAKNMIKIYFINYWGE